MTHPTHHPQASRAPGRRGLSLAIALALCVLLVVPAQADWTPILAFVGNYCRGIAEACHMSPDWWVGSPDPYENQYHAFRMSGDLGMIVSFGLLAYRKGKNEITWRELGRTAAGSLLLGKVAFEMGWRTKKFGSPLRYPSDPEAFRSYWATGIYRGKDVEGFPKYSLLTRRETIVLSEVAMLGLGTWLVTR